MIGAVFAAIGGAKYALYAGVAVALIAAGVVTLHAHDARIRAEAAAAVTAATAAAQAADAERNIAALQAQHKDDLARIAASAPIHKAIANAVPSSACIDPSPVVAVRNGLRGPGAGSGAPGHPR